jgi:hypothetical protein
MLGGLHHAASHSDEFNKVEEKKLKVVAVRGVKRLAG